MFSFSQTTGYAILALSCLEAHQNHWVVAKEIAARTGIPLPYLSKILHSLGRSGLIKAKRGYGGGFQLARPASSISLLEIAEAIEGAHLLPQCLLGLHECCDLDHCPTHAFWREQKLRIVTELRRITLDQAAKSESRLKRYRPDSKGQQRA